MIRRKTSQIKGKERKARKEGAGEEEMKRKKTKGKKIRRKKKWQYNNIKVINFGFILSGLDFLVFSSFLGSIFFFFFSVFGYANSSLF